MQSRAASQVILSLKYPLVMDHFHLCVPPFSAADAAAVGIEGFVADSSKLGFRSVGR